MSFLSSAEEATLLETASSAANRILERNLSAKGLAASIDNYPSVWTRDTVITFLGGALSKKHEFLEAFRISLETLGSRQSRFGQIPFLVNLSDDATRFGSIDANPWYVLGVLHYAAQSGNTSWLDKQVGTIVRALDWCESRDYKQRGLMESGECDDWADLLSNHGRVLFPNVLYFRALELAAGALAEKAPADAARFAARAKVVGEAIQETFWVAPLGSFEDTAHSKVRTHISITLRKLPYFLPWVGGFDYGERFDSAANMLAVLTGAATPTQTESILHFVDQAALNVPYPVRVLYPPIMPGERDWRDYYKVWANNLPDHYHNGGIWPWVGGAYVAALVRGGMRDHARKQLVSLAESLRVGREEWECNEWLHGRSGVPMGAKYQAWSAGMFLYAFHAVETGDTPGL